MKTKAVVAALVALTVTACAKPDNETADTSTVRGTDTVGGSAVAVTDTVVKTTTTDTIQGSARDTTRRDTTKTGTKTKRP